MTPRETIRTRLEGLEPNANPCWVTQADGRKAETREAIEADWSEGKEFCVYQHAVRVTVGHTDRLVRAGFTHLRVVYQRTDLTLGAVDVELSKFRRTQ